MSVLAKKRKESSLEVFNNLTQLRIDMRELSIFNFHFNEKKLHSYVKRRFGLSPHISTYTDQEMTLYNRMIEKYYQEAMADIEHAKELFDACFQSMYSHMYLANSIYPTSPEELALRKAHQDEALGACFVLQKEFEYLGRAVTLDLQKYMPYIERIDYEINLIKKWIQSNKKFKF